MTAVVIENIVVHEGGAGGDPTSPATQKEDGLARLGLCELVRLGSPPGSRSACVGATVLHNESSDFAA